MTAPIVSHDRTATKGHIGATLPDTPVLMAGGDAGCSTRSPLWSAGDDGRTDARSGGAAAMSGAGGTARASSIGAGIGAAMPIGHRPPSGITPEPTCTLAVTSGPRRAAFHTRSSHACSSANRRAMISATPKRIVL